MSWSRLSSIWAVSGAGVSGLASAMVKDRVLPVPVAVMLTAKAGCCRLSAALRWTSSLWICSWFRCRRVSATRLSAPAISAGTGFSSVAGEEGRVISALSMLREAAVPLIRSKNRYRQSTLLRSMRTGPASWTRVAVNRLICSESVVRVVWLKETSCRPKRASSRGRARSPQRCQAPASISTAISGSRKARAIRMAAQPQILRRG